MAVIYQNGLMASNKKRAVWVGKKEANFGQGELVIALSQNGRMNQTRNNKSWANFSFDVQRQKLGKFSFDVRD